MWLYFVSLSDGPGHGHMRIQWTPAFVRLTPKVSQICASFGSGRTLHLSVFKLGCPVGSRFCPKRPKRTIFLHLDLGVGDALISIIVLLIWPDSLAPFEALTVCTFFQLHLLAQTSFF
jgi:hypothetical protein